MMQGKVDLNEESDAIKSACSFRVYKAAVDILALETKDARRVALEELPKLIRPHVKSEALRIWNTRIGFEREQSEVSPSAPAMGTPPQPTGAGRAARERT
mgnify:CR=1 FL=1